MKKLLPPILFLIFVICMGLICWITGSLQQIYFPYILAGLPAVVIGLLLAATGKRLFKKLNTNIMTFDEPNMLVTQGVYQYTRNPMYLGFSIAMIGFSVLMGAAISSFLLTATFIIITDRWYIAFEEQVMLSKFGQDYEVYCQKVRRWI